MRLKRRVSFSDASDKYRSIEIYKIRNGLTDWHINAQQIAGIIVKQSRSNITLGAEFVM